MDHFDDVMVPEALTRARVEGFLENSPAPETTLHDAYHVLHTSGTTGSSGYFVYGRSGRERVVAKTDERWQEILKKKEMANLRYRIEVVGDIATDPETGICPHHDSCNCRSGLPGCGRREVLLTGRSRLG